MHPNVFTSAMITIEDGGSGLDNYPDVFVAQLSGVNSCTVAEGVDVLYPSPGDQVEREDGDSKLGNPTGDCGPVSSSSGGSSSGSSGSSGGSSSTGSGESTVDATISTSSSIVATSTRPPPSTPTTVPSYSTSDTDTSSTYIAGAGAGTSRTSGIGSYPTASAGSDPSSSAGTDPSAGTDASTYQKCRLIAQHQTSSVWRRRLSSVVRSFGLSSAV